MVSTIISFVFSLGAGTPIAFVLGVSSLVLIFTVGDINWLIAVPQQMFSGLDNFTLLSIPFFLVAGDLMNASGLTIRLVRFFNILFGRIPGNLAYVTIVAEMIFSGVSGTATSDAAALGKVLIPSMQKQGYSTEFACSLIAATATLGPIIPPSMIFIVYSVIANVSVGALFLAGLIPGAIMGLFLVGTVFLISRKTKLPKTATRATLKEMVYGFADAFLALLMPFIILGGIVFGIFTPTEAGAIAAAFALFVGLFVYRTIKLRDLPKIFLSTANTVGSVLIILSIASVFGWLLTMKMVPQTTAEWMLNLSKNPMVLYLLINLLLLFVGTFMETLASLIILCPVFLPIMLPLGVSPVHFGVVMCFNLVIGMITPPLGVLLFVVASVANIPFERMMRTLWPFLVALIAVLFLITYIPGLVTWLPSLFYK